jgi:hypothetical protein
MHALIEHSAKEEYWDLDTHPSHNFPYASILQVPLQSFLISCS